MHLNLYLSGTVWGKKEAPPLLPLPNPSYTPPTAAVTPGSPEEEPQRPHVTQVHPENAAQLLQRQHLLLLLPPGALRLAAVVGGGVAVQAGGGAHGLGHGLMVAQLPGGVEGWGRGASPCCTWARTTGTNIPAPRDPSG